MIKVKDVQGLDQVCDGKSGEKEIHLKTFKREN